MPAPTSVQEAARNLAAVAPQVYGPLPAFGPDLPAGGLPIHQTHPYGSIPIATHLPSTSRFRGALNPLATLIKKRKRSNSATGSINQNRRALRYWHADPVRQGRDRHISSGTSVSSHHSRGVIHPWNSSRPLHHLGLRTPSASQYHSAFSLSARPMPSHDGIHRSHETENNVTSVAHTDPYIGLEPPNDHENVNKMRRYLENKALGKKPARNQ